MQMTRRFQKRQPQGTRTTAVRNSSPNPPLSSDLPGSNAPAKGPLSIAKAWAWRFTASYLWVRWLLTIVNGRNLLTGAEGMAANRIGALLSLVGFAPSSGPHLGPVLVGLWLLLITGFSPIQLLAGLPLYILFFPFSVMVVLIFRKALKKSVATTQQSDIVPLPKTRRGFPVLPVAITFLVVWFLLYGGSSAQRPNVMGCIISAIIFLALAYRALDKTSPIDDGDTVALSRWAMRGLLTMKNAAQKAIDSPPKNSLEAIAALRMNGLFIKPFRCITILFKGRRGRDRIAMIMLIEYILFLIILAVSAILFWALAIRTAVSNGQAVSLATALGISASHFLPGIATVSPVSLPWWIEFGPALTSWVLFVVYIGPVGAALPLRQEAFLKQITPLHKDFRLVAKLWHVYRKYMKGHVIAFDTGQGLKHGKEPTEGRRP
jgi:hypothetical protein